MKKNKTGKKILDLAGKIAKFEAIKTDSKWPTCIGILHQPKRPPNR